MNKLGLNTLIEGCKYRLDKKYANSSIVTLIKDYGRIYVRVQDEDGNEWDTMRNRLTEIVEEKK